MDAQRWETAVELYESACALGVAERGRYLDEACAGDSELRAEVESLLEQDASRPGLLEDVARHTSRWYADAALPESIGPYRILDFIGEGGMGAVYEAWQESPPRTVALKVIRVAPSGPGALRRFETESVALGRLQHPGIAQIYEAGVATGVPYLVMERIRGMPLLEYAAAQQLAAAERIAIAIRLCDAVEHAHGRGVIHRDLKPANILVDDAGQPKILDFGVAQLSGPGENTNVGETGSIVGTLAYMSPEQATGQELDARTDVYSLGLILYELLAGRPPYRVGSNVPDAIRTVCERDPEPLGASNRGLRGDVDAIVAKALEKDRTRRYSSAADLAADLRRYLEHRPVLARPAGVLYRGRKFALRHKALAAATAAILVACLAGASASLSEAARARRAERIARAVSDFLQNDLLAQASAQSQAGPRTAPDRDLKVRTALDRAAARIEGKFATEPEVEAAIRQTIGTTYSQLGVYKDAETHMERALDLRRRVLGGEHADTLASMQELGELYIGAGKYARAEALLGPLHEIRDRKLGRYHEDTLRALNDLAGVVHAQGDYARAARLRAEVLAGTRRVLGPEHPHTLIALSNLASSTSALGHYREAAGLYRDAVALAKRVMGQGHPSIFNSMNGLARVDTQLGDYGEAEALLGEVIEGRRQALGDEHHDTLLALYSLASVYICEKRYAEARALLERGLEVSKRALPDHPDTQNFVAGLGEVSWREGRFADAESLFRQAVAARRRILGPQHRTLAPILVSLARLQLDQKRYSEAESTVAQALEIFARDREPDWRRHYCEAMLGRSLAARGRSSEAEPPLVSAYEGLLRQRDAIPAENALVLDEVGQWKSQLH